jgi:hypothetical protein
MDILLRNCKAWESLGISSFLSKKNDVMDDGSWHPFSLVWVFSGGTPSSQGIFI